MTIEQAEAFLHWMKDMHFTAMIVSAVESGWFPSDGSTVESLKTVLQHLAGMMHVEISR